MRRVVISGIGIISPVGNSPSEFFDAALHGRSGIRRICGFDTANCRTKIGGESSLPEDDSCISAKARSRFDRTTEMAVLAASAAMKDADLSAAGDREQAGVFIGSAGGCMHTTESL